MKFFLLSDNTDTLVGMRLAGIEGVVLNGKNEVIKKLNEVLKMNDVGIVLITKKLVNLCKDYFFEIKSKYKIPIMVEIPDRYSNGGSSISDYVANSIGIKI
ncbi:MAG: ATP synthase subunit F [Candidatus Paraimprobicoccus trichonymphae]|uniref:ATP synthase subunit F n=1 Tax=Candidatus Paraimprobicoccus trichonymphae TaxID=3033793 RepID=A0AA48KW44_9FIRM|nr:MAG: ATP synthase subunit F [Candidatus Paraimprobicoccus trichonymphae]